MSGRRSSTGITDFLSDLVDDIKDFLDDEIIDRGRDTERDLRRTGRNWTDSDDDRGRRRSGSRGSRDAGSQDLDELKRVLRTLSRKIDDLESSAGSRSGGSSSGGRGSDLPIAGYDDLTAVEVNERLSSLSQSELQAVDAYERAHADRSTVTGRIESLRGTEPWAGYDDQTVPEIRKALADADESTVAEVRKYESAHKGRQGVLDAAQSS
jgi:hypothetical protein